MVATDSEADARRALQVCVATSMVVPPSPDRNDWIVDCDAQEDIRALIDELIGNLGS